MEEDASIGSIANLFLGSGPEGADDLCFHTYGDFSADLWTDI